MHITAIAPYKIYPAKMGGQKGIAMFYQYLSQQVPVTVISTKNNELPANMQPGFLPVLSNARIRYINPFLFFKIRRILKKNNSTQLVLEHPYYGWLGMLLKWFCKVQLIIHSHNIESARFKSTGKWWWGILRNYEKMVHRQADMNFFVTDEDKDFAIRQFNLKPAKCETIRYGVELNSLPVANEKMAAKKIIQQQHHIDPAATLLFFNGTLDYKPNQDALDVILEQINPKLMKEEKFRYKIIICGKGLTENYAGLKSYADKNIIYAGFVDDITVYFKGVDIFINPVIDGGGIKTKLVEALGYNVSSVTTRNGAIGVPISVSGSKMLIVENGDWAGFTKAIIDTDTNQNTGAVFFDQFYWGNIAGHAVSALQRIFSIKQ